MMNTEDLQNSKNVGEMTVRRTKLPDGRYLIYFDFPDARQEDQPESNEPTEHQDTNV